MSCICSLLRTVVYVDYPLSGCGLLFMWTIHIVYVDKPLDGKNHEKKLADNVFVSLWYRE